MGTKLASEIQIIRDVYGKDYYFNVEDWTVTDEYGTYIEDKAELKDLFKDIISNKEKDESVVQEMKKKHGLLNKDEEIVFGWNVGKSFVKTYRVESRDLTKMDLSMASKSLLFTFTMYVDYNTNKISKPSKNHKDGERIPKKKLLELAGMGDTTYKKCMKELESKKIVKRIGTGLGQDIYLNPMYFCCGNRVNKETLRIFNLI